MFRKLRIRVYVFGWRYETVSRLAVRQIDVDDDFVLKCRLHNNIKWNLLVSITRRLYSYRKRK